MSLVIDASMTLAGYIEDEKAVESTAVLRRVAEDGAFMPALWRLEVLSGFQVALRRGRITAAYRDASLMNLRALPIEIDRRTNQQAWSATLRLCDRFGLTPYDAAYLELALRRRLPLATLDGELVRAAQAENVSLVGAA